MAYLVDSETRIVPTWQNACRYLDGVRGRTSQNLVLEIASPQVFTPEDMAILTKVDASIKANSTDLSLTTISNTLFPQQLYQRHGAPKFYGQYLRAITRAQKRNSWGTYARRLMEYPLSDGDGKSFNALEQVVQNLKASIDGDRKHWKSVYELPTTVPDSIGLDENGVAEIPIYIAPREGRKVSNMPCLSHLTVKLLDGHIHLTAIYRTHYYCQRALGNLVGLANLLDFLVLETGGERGSLTCVSTHATLDVKAFGGVSNTKRLLESQQRGNTEPPIQTARAREA